MISVSALCFNKSAHANLSSYTANGIGLVRMQGAGFDVSFTKDGNLFKTMYSNNSNLVNQITAVTPSYNNPSYGGLQIIDATDFNTSDGRMTWLGAKAWVNYLNSINYAGSHQWSLPGWFDMGAPGVQFGYSGTDFGYNVNPSSTPLAQLYQGELNKITLYNTSGGDQQSNYGIFGNNGAQVLGGAVGPFDNVQSYEYWLGTEYEPIPGFAWVFNTSNGTQSYYPEEALNYVWVASPGVVTTVPLPGSVVLLVTGLIGMTRVVTRRTQHP